MMTKDAKRSRARKNALEGELGGLFGTLGNAVELLGKLVEAGARHAEYQGGSTLKGLGDTARGVYGFSIRTGLGNERAARVETFGNVHATKEELVVDEVREPLVDVFDEGGEVVVTAELPGAREDEITIEQRGDTLVIASGGERHYAKEVLLPSAVDGNSLQKKYNNGVLEIRAHKVGAGMQTTDQRVGNGKSDERSGSEHRAEDKR